MIMKNKNIFLGFFLIVLLAGIVGCKKGNNYYENFELRYTEYDGTSLEFLESQGTTYDSLLLVLERVPAIRAKLKDTDAKLTFFAMTNSSFTNALDAMNGVRKAGNRLPLYLEDIPQLILDSLTYHYAFEGIYDTPYLRNFVEGKVIKSVDDYDMSLKYKVTSASGIIGGGQQQIILSDMNRSIFQRYWQESATSVVNIRTRNGMLHVLAPSHNFGFSKLAKLLNK
ncbi:Uncharacterised protein [Sphingobacterium thalpophilum]|uniref:FAS1 domain-containing protein n=2 Tax=Sphingobacterium thalpophilum TaxID=259 RepID=A0A4U9UK77_9SPHI|nr:Uncharacterised protein [Sphingobacterium thalpophilum]